MHPKSGGDTVHARTMGIVPARSTMGAAPRVRLRCVRVRSLPVVATIARDPLHEGSALSSLICSFLKCDHAAGLREARAKAGASRACCRCASASGYLGLGSWRGWHVQMTDGPWRMQHRRCIRASHASWMPHCGREKARTAHVDALLSRPRDVASRHRPGVSGPAAAPVRSG